MEKRRDFIKKSILGTAGITLGGMGLSPRSYASVKGANDRLHVAVIGIRGQGHGHIRKWCSMKDSHNVRLKTICDVDEKLYKERIQTAYETTGDKPSTEWDMRRVFDDKEIDMVSFATPNHWHALGTIWACQAGKHVYVEKPCSHNIFEGRKMVEAARKYNVRVQVGFQNRSIENVMEAMKFLREGGIGKVYMARGLCIKPRDSFGIEPNSEPPAGLHYDMWLGPASYRPYNEKRLHYNWHWFWETGNGDTGNQGPHQFDIARWGLNKNEHPVSVFSTGDIFGIDPDECEQETPNTQSSLFRYEDGAMLQFETRGRYSNDEATLGIRIGNIFYGTEGYLELDVSTTWKAYHQREKEPFAGSETPEEQEVDPTFRKAPGKGGHYGNFVAAVRAGDDHLLNCDIREGFYSTVLPHLGNISYRVGRELKFMGEWEKFENDPEANRMLSRRYRWPYIVPEQV